MPLTLPKRVSTPEDIVKFFLYLDRIDRTSFHPDDRFYSDGRVQYVNRYGAPSYTVPEAKLRDRLMREAIDVATREAFDIYDIALFITAHGMPEYDLRNAPEWLRLSIKAAERSSKRKYWDPREGPRKS